MVRVKPNFKARSEFSVIWKMVAEMAPRLKISATATTTTTTTNDGNMKSTAKRGWWRAKGGHQFQTVQTRR
jgi:hypothetical protein